MSSKTSKLLQKSMKDLKSRSPGMSIRAVAQKLQVSPSYWSKILRGQKPLTQSLFPRVVKVLCLDSQQTAQLQRLWLEGMEEDQLTPVSGLSTLKDRESSPVEHYVHLNRNDFWMLEQWFYIPVLNTLTLKNFIPTNLTISKLLGISPTQVKQTIDLLIEKGLVTMGENEALSLTNHQLRFPTDRSHLAVRKYHSMMIQKGKEELKCEDMESFSTRLISAVCYSGSSAKIKEAKLILEEAMYRAANLMAGEPECDEIYQINIQFFPLTASSKTV